MRPWNKKSLGQVVIRLFEAYFESKPKRATRMEEGGDEQVEEVSDES
jgi:hypothetical protein